MGKRALSFRASGPPLDDAAIAAFERRTSVSLPSEYVAFLKRTNGGIPSRDAFTTRDRKVESYVTSFFPLSSKGRKSVSAEFTRFTRGGLIPSTLVPIADDPADGRLLICVSGRYRGQIFYWSTDEEPDPPYRPSYRYMRLVANDFDELMALLTVSE